MIRPLFACGLAIVASVAGGLLPVRNGDADAGRGAATPTPSDRPPLYRSSVVGTDFDFITDRDPSAFDALRFVALKPFEMPDKRANDRPLMKDAYVFAARYRDGTTVAIAVDAAFGSRPAAEQEASRYTLRLGRLPSLYRRHLRHIVIHEGGADTTAFAEDRGHFLVLYSGNATRRIGTHDLEETLFHEATHAAIQQQYLPRAAWKTARTRDGAFVTHYAETDEQEDFAESALFAYTLIKHPERFPVAERERIERQIPHRIDFFRTVYVD